MTAHPTLVQTVLDARDPRELAEFYRELLGMTYRPGDEPEHGEKDWLVLRSEHGPQLAFQRDEDLRATTWPEGDVPQQFHLDAAVPDVEALERQRDRALALGARLLLDRSDDPDEPLYVVADPAGHPLCLFVP